MRTILQRVKWARVSTGGAVVGEIGPGLLVLAGLGAEDSEEDLDLMAEKIVNLRIHEDDGGKMNLSLLETGGALLVISQFTLYADCRKGRRPSFVKAAAPERARVLFAQFVERLRALGVCVQTGRFGAMMDVELCNAGPVTVILDTADLRAPRRA
ncbi:MAG: D-aminoacyl-tRNA deacylase [Candidatus Sumerlaeia bacterium]